MGRYPALTARQLLKVLHSSGFLVDRQRGSHVVLIHPESKARTVVPIHAGKTINEPLLRAILRDAGMSLADLLNALK